MPFRASFWKAAALASSAGGGGALAIRYFAPLYERMRYLRDAVSGPTAPAPLPSSMRSLALVSDLSVRMMGMPMIDGVSGATSPPATWATESPGFVSEALAVPATARLANSASGRMALLRTMRWVSFRGACAYKGRVAGLAARASKLGPPTLAAGH